MAEEQQEQVDENKRIRPRERARGQQIWDAQLVGYFQSKPKFKISIYYILKM